jgi:hypothetical protein
MAEMRHKVRIKDNGPRSIVDAHRFFGTACLEWFEKFGDKITRHHYLMAKPVKIYWSRQHTKMTRGADLYLKAEKAAMSEDKIVLKNAIDMEVEWPSG